MIINRKLNVSDEELFDYIVKLFRQEIKKQGFGDVRIQDFYQGLVLKKSIQNQEEDRSYSFTMAEYNRPKRIKIIYTTSKGTRFVDYRIRHKKDFVSDVEYEEDIVAENLRMRLKAMNNDAKTRKNMARSIKAIEQDIISKRQPDQQVETNLFSE